MMAAALIKVLENAGSVLSALAVSGPLSVADLAREVGVPRPSTYRLVEALQLTGLVSAHPDGRVQLGLATLKYARVALEQNPLARAAKETMTELRDRTGQTVYLCQRRGDHVVCLDRRQGTRVGLLQLTPGGSLPAFAGAVSRVIVASDADLRRLTIASAPFPSFTPRTLATAEELEADTVVTRARGYSVSDEDVTTGVAAIGVPLRDTKGNLVGALSVAGLRDDVIPVEAQLVGELMAASNRITNLVGVMDA